MLGNAIVLREAGKERALLGLDIAGDAATDTFVVRYFRVDLVHLCMDDVSTLDVCVSL